MSDDRRDDVLADMAVQTLLDRAQDALDYINALADLPDVVPDEAQILIDRLTRAIGFVEMQFGGERLAQAQEDVHMVLRACGVEPDEIDD